MQILFGCVDFLFNKMLFALPSLVSFIMMIRKGETKVDFFWPIRYIYIYIYIYTIRYIYIYINSVHVYVHVFTSICFYRSIYRTIDRSI